MKLGKNTQQVNGVIDRGCSMEGKLTFDGIVQINADFRGEIISDGTLMVGSEAKIDARVVVDAVVVEGCIHGVVQAKDRIELRKGSTLVADITTPSLLIEDGAVFHGKCQMLDGEGTVRVKREASSENIFVQEGDESLMM